jgi:hypothetical protein
MPDLRSRLVAQGFGPLCLDLEPDEAAVLFGLLQLGMEAWRGDTLNATVSQRLDKLSQASFISLGQKINDATELMCQRAAQS